MQDQYVGNVGDYAKFSLFQTLGAGRKRGVAWYYNANNQANDGSKRAYLNKKDYARLDPEVFNLMQQLQAPSERLLSKIEQSSIMEGVTFSRRSLADLPAEIAARPLWRQRWFEESCTDLANCDFILVDPDTALREDEKFRPQQRACMQYARVSEALRFAQQGTVLIYHHRARKADGTENWLRLLGAKQGAVAINFDAESSHRCFFLLNPTNTMRDLARIWAERWPTARYLSD